MTDEVVSLGTVGDDEEMGLQEDEEPQVDDAGDESSRWMRSSVAEAPQEEPEEQDDVPVHVLVEENPVVERKYASGQDVGAKSLRGSYSRENDTANKVARVKVNRDTPEIPAREMTGYLVQHAAAMSPPAVKATAILGYASGMRTATLPPALRAALPNGVIQRGSTDMESMLPLTMAGSESARFRAHCLGRGMDPATLDPWWVEYGNFHEAELRGRRAARAGANQALPAAANNVEAESPLTLLQRILLGRGRG